MSPKELMYIEDTLGHQKQIKATCTQGATQLQDRQLSMLVSDLAQKQASCFDRFYALLK